MTVLIPYLIKLSISLAVVYLFYQLFLRRLTFYNWNRWYLLIYSFLSFIIPFINIYPVLEKNNWDNSGMLELIPVVSYQVNSISLPIEETSAPFTFQDGSLLFISLGIGFMLIRLVIQQLSFLRIRRSSTLLLNEKIKVYQVNKNIIPFSYGNSIYVNQHLHSQEELKEIIRHEFIHVKQKHTMDILWAELLCILNWYNPFAWLIRKSVRQNLEFIADHKVLQNGIDKKEYQYLLLKVIGVSHFSIAPQFNFSSLKKRIAMMNKIKSAKVHLLKFLFVLPLMAVLLLAFRNNIVRNVAGAQEIVKDFSSDFNSDFAGGIGDINRVAAADTVPQKRKLPAHVSHITIKNEIAIVKFKNGTEETYNLNNKEEWAIFEKKYGKMPDPPIPPSAPSSGKPAKPTPPPPPHRIEEHVRIEQKENSKGYIVTIADNNGECVVIVKDKNKKIVKAMPLTEWNENEAENEGKYGDIPAPPPAKASIPAIAVPAVPPAKAKVSGVEVVPVPARQSVPAPGIDHGIIVAPSQEKFYIKPALPVHNSVQPSVRYRNWNSIGEEPLFVIDGVKQPLGEQVLNKIDPNDIESIQVLKDASSKAHYGEQAVAGVILITTKNGSGNQPMNLEKLENFEGLIILDGEEVNKERLNERVKTEDIESVDILKNEEATKAYGDKGKKGVIIIQTKKKNYPVIVTGIQVRKDNTLKNIVLFKNDRVTIKGNELFNGIYIIDGKEYSEKEYRALNMDPNSIVGVHVHNKGQHTAELFGEKGRNGVMEMKTRKEPGSKTNSNNQVADKKITLSNVPNQQKPGDEYIDRVNLKEGVMNWAVVKNSKKHPLYLLEKRIISKDPKEVERLVSKSDMYEFEIIAHGDLLKPYGEHAKDGLVNIITKANKDNQKVRLVPKKKINEEELATMLEEAAKLNVLYVGIDNPLKIQAENIPANEIEVKLEGGIVFQRHGVFYAIPQTNEEGNAKIDIYKKLKNGQTQLLNSRYFRVRKMPDPGNLIVSR